LRGIAASKCALPKNSDLLSCARDSKFQNKLHLECCKNHEIEDVLKITFLLPSIGDVPIGGFKVVYEYANALVARGHEVSVVHTWLGAGENGSLHFRLQALTFVVRRFFGWYGPKKWFSLDSRVQSLLLPGLQARYIPDADAVVATAWNTAPVVASYPKSKGKGFYLIQHFESFGGSEDDVLATWKLPLRKIVIANWLRRIAQDLNEPSHYIPNGLNFTEFGMDVLPEERKTNSIFFMYHESDWKGSKDAIRALELVRSQTEVKVRCFSATPRPPNFPDWIEFVHRPGKEFLRQLYNQAAIFLAPSWSEGWGLPPCEAMICGATVVATENGGHLEFLEHQKTGLLSPIKNPEKLAEHVLRLLKSNTKRMELAYAGHLFIQQFTWARATDALEKLFVEKHDYPIETVYGK
jgi:glycosyltransferase involved in cell wall biosynthesis